MMSLLWQAKNSLKQDKGLQDAPSTSHHLRPNSNSVQGSCSGEEREMGIHGNLLAKQADTTLRLCDVSGADKVETPSVVYIDARFL
jgi:hypothetical protein